MNGILVVNKPAAISSAGAVAHVKRLLQAGRVGHTGTLDPFARGVLVCCVNEATKLARFMLQGSKAYAAVMTLGVETDTQDVTGRVVARGDWTGVSEAAIAAAVRRFEGAIAQAPPVFSALKHEGVPLYTLARRGQPVQKPPREVRVHRIRVLAVALPEVRFEVRCSAGTYVRTLAVDIGRELGCGAHLSELTRTESGGFSLAQALTLEEVEDLTRRGTVREQLIPMAQALAGWPEITADRRLLENVRTGRRLTRRELSTPRDGGPTGAGDGLLKIMDEQGELAAVLLFKAGQDDLEYACVFARPEG